MTTAPPIIPIRIVTYKDVKPVAVYELNPILNERSALGRVIVHPRKIPKPANTAVKKEEQWFICFCGTAFERKSKFIQHQQEVHDTDRIVSSVSNPPYKECKIKILRSPSELVTSSRRARRRELRRRLRKLNKSKSICLDPIEDSDFDDDEVDYKINGLYKLEKESTTAIGIGSTKAPQQTRIPSRRANGGSRTKKVSCTECKDAKPMANISNLKRHLLTVHKMRSNMTVDEAWKYAIVELPEENNGKKIEKGVKETKKESKEVKAKIEEISQVVINSNSNSKPTQKRDIVKDKNIKEIINNVDVKNGSEEIIEVVKEVNVNGSSSASTELKVGDVPIEVVAQIVEPKSKRRTKPKPTQKRDIVKDKSIKEMINNVDVEDGSVEIIDIVQEVSVVSSLASTELKVDDVPIEIEIEVKQVVEPKSKRRTRVDVVDKTTDSSVGEVLIVNEVGPKRRRRGSVTNTSEREKENVETEIVQIIEPKGKAKLQDINEEDDEIIEIKIKANESPTTITTKLSSSLSIKCPKCNLTFPKMNNLSIHLKKSHTPGDYKCKECTCEYSTKKSLLDHFKKYHNKVPTSSKTSKTRTSTSRNTDKSPKKNEEKNSSKIGLSGLEKNKQFDIRKFFQPKNLDSNVIHVHTTTTTSTTRSSTPKKSEAKIDDDEIGSKKTRRSSVRFENNPIEDSPSKSRKRKLSTKFTCGLCGLQMDSNSRFEYHHLAAHFDGKGYKCPHCTCNFKLAKGLQTHLRVRHKP